MVVAGKLITELGIKSPATRFFNLFATQLHDVQNLCERIHGAKLHEGDDWHDAGKSVKHWTYTIDGKVQTCYESVEEIDENRKQVTFKLFGGDIDLHYKIFKATLEVIDNKRSSSHDVVKWTIEYEKNDEEKDPPNGYMDYLSKCTRDIDANLLKA